MRVTPKLTSYHSASVFGSLARKKNPPIPSTRSISLAPPRCTGAAAAAAAATPPSATPIAVRRVTLDDLLMIFSRRAAIETERLPLRLPVIRESEIRPRIGDEAVTIRHLHR